jgi:hypothetical protein
VSGQVRTNAPTVARRLQMSATEAQIGAVRTTQEYTVLLETRVKANTSGRPGPRAWTGNYRRSINGRVSIGALIIGTVGTNAPQGPRLENGFVGADSLGRVYNQPPYQHFAPAAIRTDPEYARAIGLVGKAAAG